MPKHWIVINLKAHATHPVTHGDTITLKSYFDEDLDDQSDEMREGKDYKVPSEHSVVLPNTTDVRAYHIIEEKEFLAPRYKYYVWGEPYGSAAFSHKDIFDGLSIGRAQLEPKHQKYKGAASGLSSLPSGVKADDKVIEYDLEISNSVVQYIADQMSNNQDYNKLDAVDEHMKEANRLQSLHDSGQDPRRTSPRTGVKYGATYAEMAEVQREDAFYDYGHIVHADPHPEHNWGQRRTQELQEAYFRGGGEWDHKPRVFAVWGATNRLGNSGNLYLHDLWSNIHYGFLGRRAGFSLERLVDGAAIAQFVDNFTGSDDPVDQQCTEAGFNLYAKKKKITYKDIIQIVERNSNWENLDRFRPPPQAPSVFEEVKEEIDKFDRMDQLDQLELLRRVFGG